MCEETHREKEKLLQDLSRTLDSGALAETMLYFHNVSQDSHKVGRYSKDSLKLT